jgi:hypothetical protein
MSGIWRSVSLSLAAVVLFSAAEARSSGLC